MAVWFEIQCVSRMKGGSSMSSSAAARSFSGDEFEFEFELGVRGSELILNRNRTRPLSLL